MQPYQQSTMKESGAEKLQPRFYGPYKVVKRVGEVAYELELPPNSKINNVFPISCLKKALGQHVAPSQILPPLDEEGKLELLPERILGMREKRSRNKILNEYLIKWKDLPEDDATWEGKEILEHPALINCLGTSNSGGADM